MRSSRTLTVAIAAALVAIAAGVLVLGRDGPADRAGPWRSAPDGLAGAFWDHRQAEMAVAGRAVLIAVAGRDRRDESSDLPIKVFRRATRRAGLEQAPPVPWRVAEGARLTLMADRGTPCLTFTGSEEGTVFTCLDGDGWVRRPVPSSLARGLALDVEQSSEGTWLLATPVRDASVLEVLELRDGAWRPSGPRIDVGEGSISLLGTGTASGEIAVQRSVRGRVTRRILRRTGRRWTSAYTHRGSALGPMLSGPAGVESRRLVAAIDPTETPWEFRALTGGRGGRLEVGPSLGRGSGNAQGIVRAACGHAWAVWQEHLQERPGGFETQIHAARLDLDSARPASTQTIWRGTTLGPGALDVVAADGEVLALFMRRSTNEPPTLVTATRAIAPCG